MLLKSDSLGLVTCEEFKAAIGWVLDSISDLFYAYILEGDLLSSFLPDVGKPPVSVF